MVASYSCIVCLYNFDISLHVSSVFDGKNNLHTGVMYFRTSIYILIIQLPLQIWI